MKTPFVLLAMLLMLSCSKDDPNKDCPIQLTNSDRLYEFEGSRGQRFYAWTSNAEVIARCNEQLAKPLEDRTMHINGAIKRQAPDCQLNFEWSWYFDPDDWDLVDLSIEVCDGEPQFVEENLEEYIKIGRYCPWSSVIVQEVTGPDR